MIDKILETAFYVFGYGAFLIVSCEMNVKNRTAYYVMMVPFLLIVAFMIILTIYKVWR